MFDFINRNRGIILVALIVLIFIFSITSQSEESRKENWFSSTVQAIGYYLQVPPRYVATKISNTWNHYFWLIDVQRQNEMLRERIQELKEESARNREIRIAYKRLRSNLEFRQTNPDLKVFAEVIGETKKGFSSLLIINKGSKDGIKKNFAVVSYDGIIGKIQSVTKSQSVVQLITDSHSQVPILIQRTRTKAIMSGTFEGGLIIERFPRGSELLLDDNIITSGLSGIYPKGFMVGKVKEIQKKEFGLFQRVDLVPSTDLNKIEEVAVILRSVNNIHHPLFTDCEQ